MFSSTGYSHVTSQSVHALPNEFISEHKTSTLTTRQHYNNQNWNAFLNSLDPVLDCLQSLDGNMDLTAAKNKYDALSVTQKQKVDILINTYFFRRTSKAGLSFAHSTDAKILFSWNAPEARNIAELHTMLQTRLYNDQNPSFSAEKYHKAITFSEMRELGRLQQRGEAPDYLLVSKINNQPI